MSKLSEKYNVHIIADEVYLEGTARSYTEVNRSLIKSKMNQIIEGVSNTYGAKINFEYVDGYPPTINSSNCAKKVLKAAKKVVGDKAGLPYLSMGGEDFSYYLQKRPGCFFFVGSAPDPTKLFGTPQHCSHYDIDEKSLSIGSSVFLNLVDDILGN